LGTAGIKSTDPTPSAQIVSIKGDKEVVEFEYEQYNPKSNGGFPGYDMSLRMTIHSIKLMLEQRILMELATYFSAFSAMQSTLRNAQQRISQAAQNKMKEKQDLSEFLVLKDCSGRNFWLLFEWNALLYVLLLPFVAAALLVCCTAYGIKSSTRLICKLLQKC